MLVKSLELSGELPELPECSGRSQNSRKLSRSLYRRSGACELPGSSRATRVGAEEVALLAKRAEFFEEVSEISRRGTPGECRGVLERSRVVIDSSRGEEVALLATSSARPRVAECAQSVRGGASHSPAARRRGTSAAPRPARAPRTPPAIRRRRPPPSCAMTQRGRKR